MTKPRQSTIAKSMWDAAEAFLLASDVKNPRAIVGKMLKDYEFGDVIDVLCEAEHKQTTTGEPLDPVPWMLKYLQMRKGTFQTKDEEDQLDKSILWNMAHMAQKPCYYWNERQQADITANIPDLLKAKLISTETADRWRQEA